MGQVKKGLGHVPCTTLVVGIRMSLTNRQPNTSVTGCKEVVGVFVSRHDSRTHCKHDRLQSSSWCRNESHQQITQCKRDRLQGSTVICGPKDPGMLHPTT
ncbi:hypothetical protein Glove_692g34 [Diversispora epigaea]|uniref:Uncharacterized protein n=1 Tax=Diversispora epigaea TaxID=1348612 RepID=A0A397G4S1_9GLOM|nr:hypothetical protein Glove_692g34 [Diversispora epigaea]